MKRLGATAYCVAIIGVAWLTARESSDNVAYLYERQAGIMAPLGVAGWLVSTLGPIFLSGGIWLLARRSRAHWALHLMFIPLSIAAYYGGASILANAYDVRFGVSMLVDFTLAAATGFLLVTLIAHAIALAAEVWRMVASRPNDVLLEDVFD